MFVLHKQKSTCGLIGYPYGYILYTQETGMSEGPWEKQTCFSSHLVDQKLTHFTLQQFTGASSFTTIV